MIKSSIPTTISFMVLQNPFSRIFSFKSVHNDFSFGWEESPSWTVTSLETWLRSYSCSRRIRLFRYDFPTVAINSSAAAVMPTNAIRESIPMIIQLPIMALRFQSSSSSSLIPNC